jgi:N-acetyl-anhydromuramyl-L-alanine amidase AmpD
LARALRNPPRENSDRFAPLEFAPSEKIAPANPTNYSDRYLFDIYGYSAYHRPLIVFHETVATVNNTVDFFQTPHSDEDDQASYHTLIGLDGEIIYLVPPDKRAFGAGNSVFSSENGEEAVRTNPEYPPSVNNFAYHISLESPEDGLNTEATHSGYTEAQYRSLAWLVGRTGVSPRRFTTHRRIDRSGQRLDPRSFDYDRFLSLYQTMPHVREIYVGCKLP